MYQVKLRYFVKILLIDEDCACRNIMRARLISQFHVFLWMKGMYIYAKETIVYVLII